MIHADEELIESLAQICRQRHPGVRIENWRIYVRTVIAAINGGDEVTHEPLRAAFNDTPASDIVQQALKRVGDNPSTDQHREDE